MRSALLLCVFFLCSVALANDSFMRGIGGSMRFMDGEHATVRMVQEWVRVDAYLDRNIYDVDVKFIFTNTGDATTVTMGFPESSYGDGAGPGMASTGQFRSFATWVDGRRTAAHRAAGTAEEQEYKTFWVKRVDFGRGQTRTVRVRYQADAGDVAGGTRMVRYNFTGGNWKGKLDDASLLVVIHGPGTYLLGTNNLAMWQRENRLSFAWKHWEATYNFCLDYWPTLSGAMADGRRGQLVVANAGKNRPIIEPFGLYRRGTVFVNLRSLADYLDSQMREANRTDRATLIPDMPHQQVTLRAWGHVVRFTAGKTTVIVDGTDTASPSAAFLSEEVSMPYLPDEKRRSWYIPLHVVTRIFGGTRLLDLPRRQLSLSIPVPDVPSAEKTR